MADRFGLVGAIIVAAGQSTRMEGIDKVLAPMLERPLLAWTLAPFVASPLVDRVALVLRDDLLPAVCALIEEQESWSAKVTLCPGGARRQDSVAAGLASLGTVEWVLVHDGARPCIDEGCIAAALDAAQDTGAAIPGLPLSDTIKRVDDRGLITETVPRAGLWAVQTPQVFRYAIIASAYAAAQDDVTDDAALVERLGTRVRVFPGSPLNLKVTQPADLTLAEAILRSQLAVEDTRP